MGWFRSVVIWVMTLRRRWLGLIAGIVLWLLWEICGFWATILLVVLAAIGYIAGRALEANQSWREIVERLLSDRFME